MVRRRDDLAAPRAGLAFGVHYDPDAFGEFSEGIARFLGTARFLVAQTVIVAIWIAINVVAVGMRWDPYPFILLNLAFSTQAAYAAPLILLAQSRQADRDRQETDRDRHVNTRAQADAEYMAREVASIRLSLADAVTGEDLEHAVDSLSQALTHLGDRLPPAPAPVPATE